MLLHVGDGCAVLLFLCLRLKCKLILYLLYLLGDICRQRARGYRLLLQQLRNLMEQDDAALNELEIGCGNGLSQSTTECWASL